MTTVGPRSELDIESLLHRVIEIIEGTRTLPLSSSVKLDNKEEVLELLDDALQSLPEEVKQGRWMLRERDEFVARMEREGQDIVEAARQRAERMVQRTEIVREAKHTARQALDKAREEARQLRLEAEDYCDQKLAAFEIVLERTAKTVAAGRQKLTSIVSIGDGTIAGAGAEETILAEEGFFDQDRS
jgi:hypothetical protein